MITSGNSGGPMVDSRGRLIGISTMMITPPEGSGSTLGVAIPAKTIWEIVPQLIEKGKVARGALGIEIEGYGSDDEMVCGVKGVAIQMVIPGGAAEKAGLRGGDILMKIGTQSVENRLNLMRAMGKLRPKEKVNVKFMRLNREMEVTVVLDTLTLK